MGFFKKFRLLFGGGDVIVMDVGAARVIADMQKDLDAYDFIFVNLIGFLKDKFRYGKAPAIGKGLAASAMVNDRISMLYSCTEQLRSDYDSLRRRYDGLSARYEELERRYSLSMDIAGGEDCNCYVFYDLFGNEVYRSDGRFLADCPVVCIEPEKGGKV